MSNYKYLLDWIKRTKEHLVRCFGNECGICGYSKCIQGLDFHHLDPSQKDFAISSWKSKSLTRLAAEARKCVVLCSNCHREVHHGVTKLPNDIRRFDEEVFSQILYEIENAKKKIKYNACPICKTAKSEHANYCSPECRAKGSCKVNWDSVDLYELIVVKNSPLLHIAKSLDVSENAVRKRARKLNLPVTKKERNLFDRNK